MALPCRKIALIWNDLSSYCESRPGWRSGARVMKKRRDYFIYVAELFATGMKNRWPNRIYLDLFSGPGYSRVRDTNRVVLGSPMIALTLPDPFDSYVFADENQESLDALRTRVSRLDRSFPVTYIPGDANDKVERVLEVISKTPKKSTHHSRFHSTSQATATSISGS